MPLTLVLLAAGLGSRYGGLKQLEAVGPGGESLLDYTVHDALQAGFGRLVFVIRRETEARFRSWASRFGDRAEVAFAFQELPAPLPGPVPPAARTKPWGTGHAVLVAEPHAGASFGLANADDLYGAPALRALVAMLAADGAETEHALVTFRLAETLSAHGAVARAVCRVERGELRAIEEVLGIERTAAGLAGRRAGAAVLLTGDEPVSMNLWGFRRGVFAPLRRRFAAFLDRHGGEPESEFFLPDALRSMIDAGEARVRAAGAASLWAGLTHAEDREVARARLAELHGRGLYPTPLWPR